MSTRDLILWTCLGTLTMTVGGGTAIDSYSEDRLSRFHSPTTADTITDEQFEILSGAYGAPTSQEPDLAASPTDVDESTLWLARAIYSETKLSHEQELVAWVIRNRVETEYRGNGTYKEVVLDPYQFSAFNPGSPKRSFYTRLHSETPFSSWQQALWIAHYVRHADPTYRPFSTETRHFFSEQSMQGRRMPAWANSQQYVSPNLAYRVDERRFRFYKEVS